MTAENRPLAEKFTEAAQKAGADEDEAAFEQKLKRLAKAKPQPKKPSDK